MNRRNFIARSSAAAAAGAAGALPLLPTSAFSQSQANAANLIRPKALRPGDTLNHASSVVEGRTFLDVDPVSATLPKAVGINSPLVQNVTRVENVTYYGAVGDGRADDSAAVAAALAAIPTAGGVLHFPPGLTFRIDTKLVASKSNVIWSGYGATLRFQGANTTRLMTITGDNNIFQGITFSANNAQPYGALIYVDDGVDNLKFVDCVFRDMSITTHGSNLTNQVYAVTISPYSVTNFLFRNCLFTNLTSDNTAGVVGWGFVGGINFAKYDPGSPETYNPLTAPQTVATNGLVEGCTFDTIKTILSTGLSEDDISLFDDADAIRASPGDTYNYDSSGVKRIDLKVSNSRFINVSKRAIKFSAISGLVASNNEVIADQGMYSMVEVIKMYGNSVINGLKILSPGKTASLTRSGTTVTANVPSHGYLTGQRISIIGATQQEYNGKWTITVTGANTFTYTIVGSPATPATGTIRATKSPRIGILLMTIQNTSISNVVMDAGGSFVSFTDLEAVPAQRNLMVSGFACDNLDLGGIVVGTNGAASAYSLTFANGYLGLIGDSARGIETPSAGGVEGKVRIYNVEVRNGDVKIAGRDCIVDGLHITIDRAGFTGSVANRGLFEGGLNSTTNYNVFRNIHIDVQSILSTYLNATRPWLVQIAGHNTTVQNISIRVPSTISDAYPHASFYGSDCIVDGLTYWGHGFIEMGTLAPTNGSVYRNLSRLGIGLAAATYFILTNALGTNLVIQNVTDMRTTAVKIIHMSGGGPNHVDGVVSLSTVATELVPDSVGTVRNSYKLQNIIRKEGMVTVTMNGQTVSTLMETLFLTAAANFMGVTLAAPTAENLTLVIIALSGTSDIGVVASTTAIFPAGDPTFGVGVGDVRSMVLHSAGGLWYETGRSTVV